VGHTEDRKIQHPAGESGRWDGFAAVLVVENKVDGIRKKFRRGATE